MKTPLFTCAIVAALITSASATVTMDWVNVGNPGNAADPLTGHGAVGYAYQIGKYEVTNAQYGAFLNAAAKTDSYGLYNSSMSSYGITQSGSSSSYTYSVTGALANCPVVYVSWYDAARFANWMMNGQGNASTETGAYTLNGATSGIITANIGAQVYIPSENEWYKAAYYNATSQTYSLYPNGKNTITTADANYGSGGPTAVGSYADNPSYYGTYDQGGNAFEWIDKVVSTDSHMTRGSAWDWYGAPSLMSSQGSTFAQADLDFSGIGFRLAAVPEPTSMVLTALASGMMLIRRKR
jgi:formylglycine-generating enzyme required for sulfatase activity